MPDMKWIPVTERLPDNWREVIAYRGEVLISIEWLEPNGEGAYDNIHNPAVTHWMPLPEPPEEVE